jgi:hypothetical protein
MLEKDTVAALAVAPIRPRDATQSAVLMKFMNPPWLFVPSDRDSPRSRKADAS